MKGYHLCDVAEYSPPSDDHYDHGNACVFCGCPINDRAVACSVCWQEGGLARRQVTAFVKGLRAGRLKEKVWKRKE